jgi:hypothetical protein
VCHRRRCPPEDTVRFVCEALGVKPPPTGR